jgi:hypothetical protein
VAEELGQALEAIFSACDPVPLGSFSASSLLLLSVL